MAEPENIVLHLLQQMREDMRRLDAKVERLATKDVLQALAADLRSEMHSLRADVASDLLTSERRMSEQFVALRRSVMEYHSTADGHGLLFSELEERVRRIEQRLDAAPSDLH